MCGIAGLRRISGNIDQLDYLATDKMLDDITHRGPDDHGVATIKDLNIILGHRRLSILDISTKGRQPMSSHCGKYLITYNGEIYNFLELKEKLALRKDIKWKSQSDTELLVNYISYFGIEKTLKDIVGMFAFCVVDLEKNLMHLCRDRFGEKPLYYGRSNNYFWFGSSLQQLKQIPSFDKRIDRKSLEYFLRHGYINAPNTIFDGIKKVNPGCCVTISQNFEESKYIFWDPSLEVLKSESLRLEDCEKKIEELLIKSIKRTVVSDVPIGSFLSGGIDSSLVTSLMQANSSDKIKTFSIGVLKNEQIDEAYDESRYAKKIAQYLGTEHYEDFIDEKILLENLKKVNSFYDEPFADSSQLPTLSVANLASKYVKVALSGDGADELFGGYSRYLHTHENNTVLRLMNRSPNFLKTFISKLILTTDKGALNKISKEQSFLPTNLGGKMEKIGYFLKDNGNDLQQYYQYTLAETENSHSILFKDKITSLALENDFYNFNKHQDLDLKTRIMLMDIATYLPGDILAKVDRATMAFSLESRTPYLDRDLANFAISMPIDCKIKNSETKIILKKILSKYLPRELYERRKKGFSIPLDRWLRFELKDWANELLNSDALRHDEYLCSDGVKDTYKKFINYESKVELSWYLLSYISWKRDYFDE